MSVYSFVKKDGGPPAGYQQGWPVDAADQTFAACNVQLSPFGQALYFDTGVFGNVSGGGAACNLVLKGDSTVTIGGVVTPCFSVSSGYLAIQVALGILAAVGGTDLQLGIRAYFYNNSGVQQGSSFSALAPTLVNQRAIASTIRILPPGTTKAVVMLNAAGNVSSQLQVFANFVMVTNPNLIFAVPDYGDGDLEGWHWTGQPGLSTSVRDDGSVTNLALNPNFNYDELTAPLGTIDLGLVNDEFVIDDASNDIVAGIGENAGGELRTHPYLIEYEAGMHIPHLLVTARPGRYNSFPGNLMLGDVVPD